MGKEEGLSVQLLSGFTISLVALLQGAGVASASVLHSLHQEQEPSKNFNSSSHLPLFDFGLNNLGLADFSISEEEGSWMASVWILSHLLCAPVAGFLNDKIGRRKALMIDTLIFFIGFLILTVATSLPCLILARLLLGCPLVSQVFLCEIVTPSRRGFTAAMYSVSYSSGFSLILFLGANLHWRLALAVPLFLSLPIMAALYNLRESPAWLQRMGRVQEAEEAAAFYRLSLPEPSLDLFEEEGPKDIKEPKKNLMEQLKAGLRILTLQGSAFWRNFAFLATLNLLFGWSGFAILASYAVEIFTLSGSPLSAAHTASITSLTRIICAFCSFYSLHKFSRKGLFLATAVIICLSYLTVGVFLKLSFNNVISDDMATQLNFIPMAMVILAYMGLGLGFGVIPGLLAAERIPVNIRSTVVGILVTLQNFSSFNLSKWKPVLISHLGIDGLFLFFAGVLFSLILLTQVAFPKPSVKKSKTSVIENGDVQEC